MGATLNVPACQLREPNTPHASSANLLASPPPKYDAMVHQDETPGEPDEEHIASLLCTAAAKGDSQRLKALIDARASPNAMDYDRRAALHIAAAEGHLSVVEFLLEAGADPKVKDRWGHTALDEATSGGFSEIQVALRLAGGEETSTPRLEPEDLFQVPGGGEPPVAALLTEVAEGRLEAVKNLCPDVSHANAADYDGRTPLHIAATYGHRDIVEWLLDAKADVNARDHFAHSALQEAEEHGHTEVAALLLSRGATQAMDMKALRLNSELEYWAIKSDEVQIGDVLSKTIKSVIYTANWRGTKVVIKTIFAKNKSGNHLNLMTAKGASKEVEEDFAETDSETFRCLEGEMLHEIRLLSHMRHPDLVMFLGACLDHSPPFLMTEFMEGGDLERFYMKESAKTGNPHRPSWVTFIKWASSVARALAFLHGSQHPIIHRDLKPLNLLLNANQDLKVTDFGISKLMPKRRFSSMDVKYMSGGVGTWRYMAPEMVRYEEYTDKVDIYSYALILWFMYTGLQPFQQEFGKDPELVLKEYLKGEEPRPSMICSATKGLKKTPELKELMEACWHVKASERPSAKDCTQRLADIREKYGKRSGLFQRAVSGF